MESRDISKQIEQHKLSDLHVDNDLIFFEQQPDVENQALEISMEDRGNRSLYTAIMRNDQLILIDGIRRHPIELKLHGPEHEVLVWVIQDEMSDDDIRWYRIDRSKNKKKLKVDIVSEYYFREKHMPNNQGKKDVDDDYRRKRIAKEIGVGTTTLADLLKIDRVKPSLLHQVDTGRSTLSAAKSKAKEIEEKRKEREELQEMENPTRNFTPDLNITNKHIDLKAVPTCCPCCKRPYSTLDWKDIPDIFNYKREESDTQTDWLEAVA